MNTITTVIGKAVDIDAGICHPCRLHKRLVRGNALAHAFEITCYRNDRPVDLTGTVCNGYVRREDGKTVKVAGSVQGNVARIVLTAACYLVVGAVLISIELEMDGVVATHGAWLAEVVSSRTDVTIEDEGGGTNWVELPEYWQTPAEEKVQAINTAMSEASGSRSAFLFYTDAHWTYSYRKGPTLLAYLTQQTAIKKTFYGGDIIGGEEDLSYLDDWRAQLALLPSHHSVAGNHDDSIGDDLWGLDYVREFLLDPEATEDVVRGENLYYYIDAPAESTRYLFLDTATREGNILNDPAEEEWLKSTLLSAPAGWHIIAIAHTWKQYEHADSGYVAIEGFTGGGTICLDMFDAYNARTGDFSACTGRVEFCIGGHLHWDATYVSNGGIPVLLMACESYGVRNGETAEEGTITETAVSAVIADYNAGVIKVFRLGRGNDRVVNLDGSGIEEDNTWMDASVTRVKQTSNDTVAVEWDANIGGVTYIIYDNGTEVGRQTNNTQIVLFDVSAGNHSYTVQPERNGELGNMSAAKALATVADVGYTNVLRTCLGTDGLPYNGGYGYKENTRVSNSDGAEKSAAGWDCTGAIPIARGDIVRLRDMAYYDLDGSGGSVDRTCVIGFLSDFSSFTVSSIPLSDAWNPVHGTDGNLAQFTMVSSWNSGITSIRITARNIDAFSVITVNEEID